MTESVRTPIASAVCASEAKVGPIASGPPGQVKRGTWTSSSISSSIRSAQRRARMPNRPDRSAGARGLPGRRAAPMIDTVPLRHGAEQTPARRADDGPRPVPASGVWPRRSVTATVPVFVRLRGAGRAAGHDHHHAPADDPPAPDHDHRPPPTTAPTTTTTQPGHHDDQGPSDHHDVVELHHHDHHGSGVDVELEDLGLGPPRPRDRPGRRSGRPPHRPSAAPGPRGRLGAHDRARRRGRRTGA